MHLTERRARSHLDSAWITVRHGALRMISRWKTAVHGHLEVAMTRGGTHPPQRRALVLRRGWLAATCGSSGHQVRCGFVHRICERRCAGSSVDAYCSSRYLRRCHAADARRHPTTSGPARANSPPCIQLSAGPKIIPIDASVATKREQWTMYPGELARIESSPTWAGSGF
jgi:hypothetical protein